MGMICMFWRFTSSTMELLPNKIAEGDSSEVLDLLEEDDGRVCFIDKAWDGLNYLFSGTDFSLDFPNGFIRGAGAKPVLEEAMEEFPILFFSQEKTVQISQFLDSLTHEQLHKNYNPEKMDEDVYPGRFVEQGEKEFEWLYEMYEKLRDFFRLAASEGEFTAFSTE